jgi:hypothetical protein
VEIVICAVPLLPSLVAVIVTVPTARAVTNPLAVTAATVESDEAHVTARPDRTLFAASLIVAVSCTVPPTCSVLLPGVTATLATGAGGGGGAGDATVTCPLPLTPSLDAVMVAPPLPVAVTRPPALTVATAEFEDDHVTVRPVRTLPTSSRVTAVNWTCPPTVKVEFNGETRILATGAGVGEEITTQEVSAALLSRATTGKVPATDPAVNQPAAVIEPPLVLYCGVTRIVESLLNTPVAVNWALPPVGSCAVSGVSTIRERVTGSVGGRTVTVPAIV